MLFKKTTSLLLILFGLFPFSFIQAQISGDFEIHVEMTGNGNGTVTVSPKTIPTCDDTKCIYAYQAGTQVTLTATPSDEDSYFYTWGGSTSCRTIKDQTTTQQGVARIIVTRNVLCTANFRLNPFKLAIIYGGNGSGEVTMTPAGAPAECAENENECQQYNSNTTITEVTLTTTPHTGSSFLNWGGDLDCSDGQVSMNKSKDCIATFILKTYSLTVTNIGTGSGSVFTEPATPTNLDFGTEVRLQATPDNGMDFTGWGGDCAGTDNSLTLDNPLTVVLDDNKNCSATFMPIYNLTVNPAGEGSIEVQPTGKDCGVNCNTYPQGTALTLTAQGKESTPTEQGSKFTIWGGDCTGTDNPLTLTLADNMECTANFERIPEAGSHNITAIVNGNGIATITNTTEFECGPRCKTFPDGTDVTLTAEANAGAIFMGWTGDCTDIENSITVQLNSDKTCIANFEIIPPEGSYNLKGTATGDGFVTVAPPGNDCGLNCSTYLDGTTVTLTANFEPNSASFTSWSGDCSGTELTTSVVMDTSKICTANFASLPEEGFYNLIALTADGHGTLIADENSIDCGVNCFNYVADTTATLTVTPRGDSEFLNWAGACEENHNPQIQVVMDDNKTCTAHFKLLPPSSVQFSIPKYVVNEADGVASLLVTRATSGFGNISVNYQITDITTTVDRDYSSVSEPIVWKDGDMEHKTFEIPIFLDTEAENDEILKVTLTDPTGGAIFGPNQESLLTIVDTPPTGAGSLQFSATQYGVQENTGTATLSVERIGGNIGAVSVTYFTTDETAVSGSDYTLTQGILNWSGGDTQLKTIMIPILEGNDEVAEETEESFLVTLSNPIGGANVGANRTATISIFDSLATPDTSTVPGILQFTAPIYQVAEDSGEIAIAVKRTFGHKGNVAVDYTTQDGTAQADSDYLPISGTLNWADGEDELQNIMVSLLTDDLEEDEETFTIKLSSPTGEASLGAIPATTVKIVDELATPVTIVGEPGILQFTASNYQIAENGGLITITVTRTEGQDGEVEVTYNTVDDTATSSDYFTAQDILRWEDGDSEAKSFQIEIQDDSIIETKESLRLILSEPTGGAELGLAEVIVTILDDDATTLQSASDTYVVDEDSQVATITVSRLTGKVSDISMQYQTLTTCQANTENCATPGEDYRITSGFLFWVSGNTSDKSFSIPIFDDTKVEGNEIVQIQLTETNDNAKFGGATNGMITVIIQDNDPGDCQPVLNEPIIACYWENHGNTLQDATITQIGTVVGGQLGGNIHSEGILQDVTLLANTRLFGNQLECEECSIMRGNISSDPEFPALLSQVKIITGSTLSHLIVGAGSEVDSGVILKAGVWFEHNSDIPYMADLKESLETISATPLDIKAINLTGDVLLNRSRNGILDAINGLHDVVNFKRAIRQNLENGYLTLDLGTFHYRVLPMQVRQIWGHQTVENKPLTPMGVIVAPNNQVTFVTHTGREVVNLPVVHNPSALREALKIFALNETKLQTNGNVKVPNTDGVSYYMARPDLFATDIVPSSIPLGLGGAASPRANTTDLFLIYAETPDNWRQQFMYPAPANPEALAALLETSDSQTTWYSDGRVEAYTGIGQQKQAYKGILDYLINPGPATTNIQAQIDELNEDRNSDGLNDYLIRYPNGDTQVMYQCPTCFDE